MTSIFLTTMMAITSTPRNDFSSVSENKRYLLYFRFHHELMDKKIKQGLRYYQFLYC